MKKYILFFFLYHSLQAVSFMSQESPAIYNAREYKKPNKQGQPNQVFKNQLGQMFVDPRTGDGGRCYGMILQPDLKILLIGSSLVNGVDRFTAIRLHQNGSLDLTFGNGGTFYYNSTIASNGLSDEAYSGALQSTGKIILYGITTLNTGENRFALMRLTVNGELDRSFGNNGVIYIVNPIAGGGADQFDFPGIKGLVIRPDDKILVVGTSTRGAEFFYAIAQFTKDGQLDTTFGTNGTTYLPIHFFTGGTRDVANAVILQSDGKAIVAGKSRNAATQYRFSCARLLVNGQLDTTFGINGYMTLPYAISGNITSDSCNDLVLQRDEKIILAGQTDGTIDDTNRFALARLTKDGLLDITFGNSGTTYIPQSISGGNNNNDILRSIVLQQYGNKLIVAGSSNNRFALARFNKDGFLDATFGNKEGSAYKSNYINGLSDFLYDIAIDQNSYIWAAGSTGTGAGGYFALANYENIPTTTDIIDYITYFNLPMIL